MNNDIPLVPKVLCICQAGCVRSVALAYTMKFEFSANAIAVGVDFVTNEEWPALLAWATDIFLVSHDVQAQFHDTLKTLGITDTPPQHLINLGEDRWGMRKGPYNEQLLELAYAKVQDSTWMRRYYPLQFSEGQ